MKNLRTLITVLMLVVTLGYTVIAVSPALAGPPTPDMECFGFACHDYKPSCAAYDPTTPAWYCTNLCIVGGREVCMGQAGCTMACP